MAGEFGQAPAEGLENPGPLSWPGLAVGGEGYVTLWRARGDGRCGCADVLPEAGMGLGHLA